MEFKKEAIIKGDKLFDIDFPKNPGWLKEYSSGSQSTNSSSFNGLPGGSRSNDGPFYGIGSTGFWWSSPKRARSLSFNNGVVGRASALEVGFSVRCLRD